jgi:hypothetical protein
MNNGGTRPLKLRVGDLAEVRTEQEILATLDDQGAIDGLPFMPEMLEFCGKRFRVEKRADKTCNTITVPESRRLHDTVHLEGLRCTGEAHGGCQAQCFLFWKEAWLKRVAEPATASQPSHDPAEAAGSPSAELRCDRSRLEELTRRQDHSNAAEEYYRCQATDLLKASESLPWWDFRQYVRDLWSGNVGLMDLAKASLFHLFLKSLKIGFAYRAQVWAYNRMQAWRGATPYPFRQGQLEKTPRETLDLRPGELVQIKSYDEILETLSKKNRNRGMWFGPEMVPYCGSVRRVRARVERIIEERTGKLMTLPGECLILEDVICRAEYSERRLFCPRNIFPYWREIWLKRAEETADVQAKLDLSATAQAQEKTQSSPS